MRWELTVCYSGAWTRFGRRWKPSLVEQNESEIELQGGDIIAVRRDFLWVERNWEAIDSGEKGRKWRCPSSLAFGLPSPFPVCFSLVRFSQAILLGRLLSPSSLPTCTFPVSASTVFPETFYIPGCMLPNHSIQPFKHVQLCSADRASSVIVCMINVFHLPNMTVTSCGTRFT